MARRISQEEADLKVKEAIKNQGDSLVVKPFIYTNRDIHLDITCRVCGKSFTRDFRSFTEKSIGCLFCRGRDKSEGVAEELLIKESNGRYSWKPFEFKTTKQRIDCICNTCGFEWTAPYDRLTKQHTGCPKCSGKMKHSKEDVIKRIRDASKGRYSFDDSFEYKNLDQKVECICNTCGREWKASVDSLMRGSGCSKCGNNLKLSKEEVLSRLTMMSNGRYTWSDFEYEGLGMKICLRCNTCDYEWMATVRMLTNRGDGCPRCSNHLRLSKEEVIRRIEEHRNGRYTYSDFEYRDVTQKIPCECKRNGHKFMQSINSLMRGSACPYCSIIKSNPEDSIYNFISGVYDGEIVRGDRSVIPSPFNLNRFLELDIYIPSLRFAIEFNGSYWHRDDIVRKCSNWESAKHKHGYKSDQCKMRGIYLMHIDEKDWNADCNSVMSRIGRVIEIIRRINN